MPVYALGDVEPRIHRDAYVHPDAVIIGDVTIGAESTVWPSAVLRGDDGAITIGERTSIQDGAVIHTTPTVPTVVGDDCTVGHLAHLEACRIEDMSLVGTGSIVLHRAVVGPGALVGAGAVVTNDMVVPPGAMALGIPAKIREDCVDLDEMADGARSYVARGWMFREKLRRLD